MVAPPVAVLGLARTCRSVAANRGVGGGSNLVPQGGCAVLASGDPSVAIRYQAGVGSGPPPEKQACQKGGWKELGFKNQGACIKGVNHPS
jgi:hypothetical protein